MQIGGVFGLTVPNIFITDVKVPDVVKLINRINYAANAEVIKDFKTELAALASIDTVLIARPKIDIKLEESILGKSWNQLKDATELQDVEDKINVINYAAQVFTQKVIEYERQNLYFDVPKDKNKICEVIEDTLNIKVGNKSIGSSLVRVINRLAQSFVVDEPTEKITPWLVANFNFEFQFPERVNIYTAWEDEVDGMEFEDEQELLEAKSNDKNIVTELDKKILQYLINRKSDILDVLSKIGTSTIVEQTIFGVEFEDIIRRKPSSILYQVSGQFASVKGTTNGELLANVRESVRTEINKYKELLDTKVEVMNAVVTADILSEKRYEELRNSLKPATAGLFNKMFSAGDIRYSDILVNDFDYYDFLVDLSSKVTPEYLNQKFNVSLSRDEWYEEFERLCNFGVYGLNVDGLVLTEAQFPTILVTNSVKAKMHEQDLKDLRENIADVEALLDSLLPFGEII